MAMIKHIAITSHDQQKTAEFYIKTFGMQEVWRHRAAGNPNKWGIYLSDGYINLAILPGREGAPEGINHFGFEIDDIEATAKLAATAGATALPEAPPQDGRFAEAFIKDPVGTRVDLSTVGWRTEPADSPDVLALKAEAAAAGVR